MSDFLIDCANLHYSQDKRWKNKIKKSHRQRWIRMKVMIVGAAKELIALQKKYATCSETKRQQVDL